MRCPEGAAELLTTATPQLAFHGVEIILPGHPW